METWRDEDKKVVRVRKLHYTYFMVMKKISKYEWKCERMSAKRLKTNKKNKEWCPYKIMNGIKEHVQ